MPNLSLGCVGSTSAIFVCLAVAGCGGGNAVERSQSARASAALFVREAVRGNVDATYEGMLAAQQRRVDRTLYRVCMTVKRPDPNAQVIVEFESNVSLRLPGVNRKLPTVMAMIDVRKRGGGLGTPLIVYVARETGTWHWSLTSKAFAALSKGQCPS